MRLYTCKVLGERNGNRGSGGNTIKTAHLPVELITSHWGQNVHHQKDYKQKCGRGCGERGGSCTVGGNVNCCRHYGESLKTTNRFTNDPAIPLLGIYPEKTIIPMFTAALFVIATTWKQPKHPPPEKQMNKMWYIYTMEYYSAIKMSEIVPFAATWMDQEIIILSELN